MGDLGEVGFDGRFCDWLLPGFGGRLEGGHVVGWVVGRVVLGDFGGAAVGGRVLPADA